MGDLTKYSDEDIINIVSSNAETELQKRGYEYGWYKKEPFVGVIYILVNPAFPDLVKIGYADDIQKRLRILNSNSGLPDPYHCFAIYKVKKRLEDLRLHNLIDMLDPSLRHSKNREFYEMNYYKAYNILSAIAQINGDEEQLVKNPYADTFFEQSNLTLSASHSENTNQKRTKEPLTFRMLNIPVGATLTFIKNVSITCTTINDTNKVEYLGKTYSISSLAAKLLHFKAAQGGKYFMYNGEILTDLRLKTNTLK